MVHIRIKHSFAYLAILALCVGIGVNGHAEKIFDEPFEKAVKISSRDNSTSGLTVVGHKVYNMLINGDIYTWDADQDQYAFFAKVPERPKFNSEIAFTRQKEGMQKKLTEYVFQLIPSDEGLYGFNHLSGLIGPIDQNGWHPSAIRLDTSKLKKSQDDYPEELINAFIRDKKLYAFYDRDWINPGPIDSHLVIFDLGSGACTMVKMPNIITFSSYTPGNLICIKDIGGKTPVLTVYNITSGQQNDLGIHLPTSISQRSFQESWNVHTKISGLSYDEALDIIYVADKQGLWRITGGGDFEQAAIQGRWPWIQYMIKAWSMPSGGYVMWSNGIHYFNP